MVSPTSKYVQAISIGMGISIDKSLQVEKFDARGPTAFRVRLPSSPSPGGG
jgi:hypothetical protein